MLWLRLYKRELFTKPVLPKQYTNNEDMFALPCLLHMAKSIFFLKEHLHTYSTDNEGGVMLSETYNPQLAERRFKSRSTALLCISHFREFVGDEDYKEYVNEHSQYTAEQILGYLLIDFNGKSIQEKESVVKTLLGFKSQKELKVFLNWWLPRGTNSSYLLYRIFGINLTYLFYRFINKIKK